MVFQCGCRWSPKQQGRSPHVAALIFGVSMERLKYLEFVRCTPTATSFALNKASIKSYSQSKSSFCKERASCFPADGHPRRKPKVLRSSKRSTMTHLSRRNGAREYSPQLLSLARTGVDITFDILKEQVRLFQPDTIFIYAHALTLVPMAARTELRSVLNNHVLLTGYWGDELPRECYQDFRDLDFVFCSSSVYQNRFMEWTGIPAETIGNCFDNVIEVKEPHGKKYDFIFCGRTGYRLAQHVARYNKLAEIASRTDLQIWGYEWPEITPRSVARRETAMAVLAAIPTPALALSRRFVSRASRLVGERGLLRRATHAIDGALGGKRSRKENAVALLSRFPKGILTVSRGSLSTAQRLLGQQTLLQKAQRAFELALDGKGKDARGVPRNESERTQEYWQGEYWYDKKPMQKLFPERFKPLLTNGSDYYALLVEFPVSAEPAPRRRCRHRQRPLFRGDRARLLPGDRSRLGIKGVL